MLFLLILITFIFSCSSHDIPSYWIRTTDGCKLPVFTYPGSSTLPAIIYLHGLGANHNNFDAVPSKSFARILSKKGFKGFAIDFRGHGASHCNSPRIITIGRLWRYDLKALIKSVKKRGVKKYFIMGHSLGGITDLAYGSHVFDTHLIGIIAIAAPVTFSAWQRKIYIPLINLLDKFKFVTPYAWSFPGNYIVKPFSPYFLKKISLLKLLGNVNDISPSDVSIMITRAVSPTTPIKMVDQLKDAIEKGPLIDEYNINYLTSLKDLKYPVLLIAGDVDKMAPAEGIRLSYKYISSRDKFLVVMGKPEGFKHDYGHIDLVVGVDATEETLPVIEKWLKKHLFNRGGDRSRTGE